MNKLIKSSTVSSGSMNMPIVGLGTWQANDNVENGEIAIESALEAGYRHIDTAFVYGTEELVGKTINKSISSGKYKREELFIVTKLPSVGNKPEHVESFLKKSLKALNMDYVDLYLIHWPAGLQYSEDNFFPKDSSGNILLDLETDLISLWKAMEEQVDAGRAKSIGISNFNIDQMQRILKVARIPPANLQVELHIYFQQKEIIKFCKDNNITVCAYSPLGSPGMKPFAEKTKMFAVGDNVLSPLTEPLVVKLAEKYKKTPGQILLRFLLQLGVVVIPKSTNPQRIKQNIDLFDFELSDEDMESLRGLDKGDDGRIFNSDIFKGYKSHPECPF